MTSKLSLSLPKTEVACGSVTIRKDELTLTLHCMFCELAYEKIELLRSHLLHAHVVEIVGTKEKLKDAPISSEAKSWSETRDMHCLRDVKQELEEFSDEDLDCMDPDADWKITIKEERLQSPSELRGVMVLDEENISGNVENKISAPLNTKVSGRYLDEIQTVRFIELLKEAVCLWDTRFMSYCYRNVRNAAFKELTQKLKEELPIELEINEKYVRAKINQLKTVFRCYESTGSNNEHSAFPFSHLSFLHGHVPSKRGKCVICGEEMEDDNKQAHQMKHIIDEIGGKCRLCNVHLPSKRYVVSHMSTHQIYICLHCNRDDFTTQASYRDHFAEMHPQKILDDAQNVQGALQNPSKTNNAHAIVAFRYNSLTSVGLNEASLTDH